MKKNLYTHLQRGISFSSFDIITKAKTLQRVNVLIINIKSSCLSHWQILEQNNLFLKFFSEVQLNLLNTIQLLSKLLGVRDQALVLIFFPKGK